MGNSSRGRANGSGRSWWEKKYSMVVSKVFFWGEMQLIDSLEEVGATSKKLPDTKKELKEFIRKVEDRAIEAALDFFEQSILDKPVVKKHGRNPVVVPRALAKEVIKKHCEDE